MGAQITLPAELQPLLASAASLCRERGLPAWLVGGSLRDLWLGRPLHDLDLLVPSGAVELARTLADRSGGAFVLLDDQRQTARTIVRLASGSVDLDWAEFRAGTLEGDLRLRDMTINAIAAPLDLLSSQGVLDESQLVDPQGGLADLQAGQLRACSPACLQDDPLRALRVVRQAAQLGFAIAPELDLLLRRDARLIARVAAERVRDELVKLLALDHSAVYLRYLELVGLLPVLLPELQELRQEPRVGSHAFNVLDHSYQAVCAGDWLLSQLERRALAPLSAPLSAPDDPAPPAFFALPAALRRWPDLRVELPYAEELLAHLREQPGAGHPRRALWKLSLLLHDSAKPRTRRVAPDGDVTYSGHQELGAEMAQAIAERLRFSRHESAYVALLVAEHMRPGQLASLQELSRRAIYRFYRDTGEAATALLVHALADHMAARGAGLRPQGWQAHVDWTAGMLQARYAEPELVRPPRLLDGHALMRALGLPAGPEIGRLLELIAEAQAAGEVRTLEQALALAREAREA